MRAVRRILLESLAVGAGLLALPWVIQLLVKYTTELFRSLPSLIS